MITKYITQYVVYFIIAYLLIQTIAFGVLITTVSSKTYNKSVPRKKVIYSSLLGKNLFIPGSFIKL